MATKWTVKDVLQHARELKSPFESLKPKLNPNEVLKGIRDRGNGNLRRPVPKVPVRK
jgi:hypothetical protein